MEANDFKPCGRMEAPKFGVIEIMFNETNDAVLYSKNGKVARRWKRIRFSKSGDVRRGDAYFTISSKRFYFKDFVYCR